MDKNICKNCSYYSAYYKQRGSGYEKLSYGTCSVQKKECKKKETCGKFYFDEKREKRRQANLLISLQIAAKSINDIAAILKENKSN